MNASAKYSHVRQAWQHTCVWNNVDISEYSKYEYNVDKFAGDTIKMQKKNIKLIPEFSYKMQMVQKDLYMDICTI